MGVFILTEVGSRLFFIVSRNRLFFRLNSIGVFSNRHNRWLSVLPVPAGSGASLAVYHPVAGQAKGLRHVLQGLPHQPGILRASQQAGDLSVGHDVAFRDLPDNVVNFGIKFPGGGVYHPVFRSLSLSFPGKRPEHKYRKYDFIS